jgi:hypothetical protein
MRDSEQRGRVHIHFEVQVGRIGSRPPRGCKVCARPDSTELDTVGAYIGAYAGDRQPRGEGIHKRD